MVDSGLGVKSAGNPFKTPNLGLRIGDTSRGAGDLRGALLAAKKARYYDIRSVEAFSERLLLHTRVQQLSRLHKKNSPHRVQEGVSWA